MTAETNSCSAVASSAILIHLTKMKKTKRLIRVTTTKKVSKKPEVKISIGYVGLHKRRKTK